jgi:hypothetical protein
LHLRTVTSRHNQQREMKPRLHFEEALLPKYQVRLSSSGAP